MSLVLASASPTRRRMLERAGVGFSVDVEAVDEGAARLALMADGASAAQAATELARLKARPVSRRQPGALVVGADQILEHRGLWLEKPHDRMAARVQLAGLRGDTHRLVSAVVVFRDGAELWHHADAATLEMHGFSDAFLDRYLDAAGDAVLASVGAYQLEALGAQLFDAIAGDHFTILGLPLLPLLAFLRAEGEMPS